MSATTLLAVSVQHAGHPYPVPWTRFAAAGPVSQVVLVLESPEERVRIVLLRRLLAFSKQLLRVLF